MDREARSPGLYKSWSWGPDHTPQTPTSIPLQLDLLTDSVRDFFVCFVLFLSSKLDVLWPSLGEARRTWKTATVTEPRAGCESTPLGKHGGYLLCFLPLILPGEFLKQTTTSSHEGLVSQAFSPPTLKALPCKACTVQWQQEGLCSASCFGVIASKAFPAVSMQLQPPLWTLRSLRPYLFGKRRQHLRG